MAQRIAQRAFNWLYGHIVITKDPPCSEVDVFTSCPKFFYMEDQEFMDKFMQETDARAKEIDVPIPSNDGTKDILICPVDDCKTTLKERQTDKGFFEMYCPECGGAKIYWRKQ